jgi:hypothetical protein
VPVNQDMETWACALRSPARLVELPPKGLMRTVTKLTSLLLLLLMLTSCRSSESEEKITSRYVDTLSSVEGVTEVRTEWRRGGGVAGTFMDVRIHTSTDDPVELEAIQYRAWEDEGWREQYEGPK